MGIGKRFPPFSIQINATVERLTNCIINVGIAVSQRSYLILDASNSLSGFSASVAQMVYLVGDLVRIAWP